MKKALALFLLFFNVNSFAKSSLVGVWVDEGSTLSIQILDNPSEGPFTAGELWQSMSGNSANKSVKTKNMDMRCSALSRPEGGIFGSCSIEVKSKKLQTLGLTRLFILKDIEGSNALKGFHKNQKILKINYESGDFVFQINWLKENVAFIIMDSLIQK